ncbi:hypothetical protein BECAL_01090 [Bellilinea caldifistulae]|nr:ABC transporter permease [Bellilinea caldifistulae]GAP09936.1 hypothetical protein BECAL_01090 [Bellilinea caldifistulae]
MRLDLLRDLWLERRRRFAFWCIMVVGWSGVCGLLFPVLVDEIWVEVVMDWFNPALDLQQGYWLVALPAVGLPVLGGSFAFLEGGSLFKGQTVRHAIAFLLAYPLPRWQVYFSRLAYLLSACFLLTVAGYLSGSGMILLTGYPLPAGLSGLLPGTFLLILLLGELGVLFGMLSKSFWLDRLAGIVFLFLVYLPFGMRSGSGWVRYSPLFYVLGESPLMGGVDVVNLLVLSLLCVAGGLAGGYVFERLELE